MSLISSNIQVVNYNGKWVLKGFTVEDYRTLGILARNVYKLKSKRKRIVKKYIVKLMNEAIRKYLITGA
jgi:hypothetical protein